MAGEESTTAYLIVSPELQGEDLAAVETIRTGIEATPDFVEETIDLYSEDPEAVGRVLDFLYEHPEGAGTLQAWRRIVREKLETDVEFDPETERIIEEDPYFRSVKKDFDHASKDDHEKFAQKLRARRWKIFINRSRQDAA